MKIKSVIVSLVLCTYAMHGAGGQAPVYKLLFSPGPTSNLGGLFGIFEASPGLFYIFSSWNGGSTGPSIFTVTSSGAFAPIYSFPQASNEGAVVEATNGLIYGSGALNTPPYPNFYFSISLSGKNEQQYAYPGTWGPGFSATVAPPSQIYDLATAVVGGQTVYAFDRISESGQISILHQFSGTDGVPNPYAHLVLGSDGNLYGIGAQKEHGISPQFIYRFAPSGTYSVLLNFPQVPGYNAFPLVAASDGNLYGSFSNGGTNGTGVLYKATLSGELYTMASFPASIRSPRTLMQAADGNLYGTTVYNQIFRYNVAANTIELVYQMDPGGSQGHCACILVEGTDGKLYGVAQNGGNYPGQGAVFSLDIGLPKPAPTVSGLYPSSGAVGEKVVLWGNYLLAASSVSFNGVPAQHIGVTSVQSVYALVPPGATSGPVTVTTPNGSFATTSNFTVTEQGDKQ